MTDLVTRVAAIIPLPGDSLCADDPSWLAFDQFLGEAARQVAGILGSASAPELRELLASPRGEDVMTRLLIERALELI